MTPDEQLKMWVLGNSIHNHDRFIDIVGDNDKVIRTEKLKGGECCPDFSCCNPSFKWSQEMREKFVSSDEVTRWNMLSMSLSQLSASVQSESSITRNGL